MSALPAVISQGNEAGPPMSPIASRINALIPKSISDALALADVMAKASMIPDHLRNKPGDCLLIVMQAQRWGMDAASVAQCTSVVKGKMCYEGKLVAAALYAMGAIDGRLRYEFSGNGADRKIVVTGKLRGGPEQTVEGTVKDWKTDNGNWQKSPDDMLVYRGTRQWARRYAPEVLLGVYTPDEMEEDDRPRQPAPALIEARTVPAAYPPEDFAANLPKWKKVIESGRKTADEIIAMASSKGTLTEGQVATIKRYSAIPVASSGDHPADGNGEVVTFGEDAP